MRNMIKGIMLVAVHAKLDAEFLIRGLLDLLCTLQPVVLRRWGWGVRQAAQTLKHILNLSTPAGACKLCAPCCL